MELLSLATNVGREPDPFLPFVRSGLRGRPGLAGRVAKQTGALLPSVDNWGPFVAICQRLDRLPRTGVFLSFLLAAVYVRTVWQ
jgi:hypothetical protein